MQDWSVVYPGKLWAGMSWNLKLNYIQKEKNIWSKQRLLKGPVVWIFGMSISTAVSITKVQPPPQHPQCSQPWPRPSAAKSPPSLLWRGLERQGFFHTFQVKPQSRCVESTLVGSSRHPESESLRIPKNGDLIHIIFRFQPFVFSGGESQLLIQQKDVLLLQPGFIGP